MKAVFKRPESLLEIPFHFCPGCGHGIVHRLVAEAIDTLEIRGKTIGVVGVGCSSTSWKYFNCDMAAVPHGRAAAVATAIKRNGEDNYVFTYQGDGDAISIGIAETMFAAIRGEKITVILVNNTVYAMTGGQMAPTTLEGQITCSSPKGRDVSVTGYPLHFPELIANIPGVAYSARVAIDTIPNIRRTKNAIIKAFEKQKSRAGFTLVEILSPCPTIWHKSPTDSMDWISEAVSKEFSLGVFKE